jgi:hypothetical protein
MQLMDIEVQYIVRRELNKVMSKNGVEKANQISGVASCRW